MGWVLSRESISHVEVTDAQERIPTIHFFGGVVGGEGAGLCGGVLSSR